MSEEMRYYRIAVDSDTGCKLTSLYEAGKQASDAACRLAKSLRAEEFEMHPGFAMGGISAFYFKFKPAKRRFDIRDKVNGLYLCIPNTSTKEGMDILRKTSELPVVKMEQVAEAFGIQLERELPTNALLPMFFRVDRQWDYVKTALPLDIPELMEVSQKEFDEAYQYVAGGES